MIGKIIAYEAGEMEPEEIEQFFQELVDTGMINHLQGHYGRAAQEYIEAGLVHI